MNHTIQGFIDRVLNVAPMPPEAYPGGIVGRAPAVRSLAELAWQQMSLTMFVAGFVAGLTVATLFTLSVVFKTSIPAIMKAIAHAP